VSKKIANISSYKRTEQLINTVKSIINQFDEINICLNDFEDKMDDIFFNKKIKIYFTDNSIGDGFKFFKLKDSDGYYFTLDDDLIYPNNYADFMIENVEKYNRNKIITLHGRKFKKFPIDSYYNSSKILYHFQNENNEDSLVHVGGTGVMCFHTDTFKFSHNLITIPNMADIWISKFAKEKNLDIICVKHKANFVKQQKINESIFLKNHNNDKTHTLIINKLYHKNDIKKNIIIVSTFWNAGKYVKESIESLKEQTYNNFISYFIDDMSTDNSYEIAKNTIGNDSRFVLIKNTKKKYKTKNFIDIIKNNPVINDNDVIVELDGDDKLSDKFVLEKINNVFENDNIWLCGTKWKDRSGRLGNYKKPNPEKARSTSWNFSHMRSFRSFLFRQIKDEHFKINGEYFKAACDLGHGIPMLEMAGSEHFHYIDEPLYIYTWHQNQSYSSNGATGNKSTQGITAKYIYNLPKYEKIILTGGLTSKENDFKFNEEKNKKQDKLSSIINSFRKEINYEFINSRNNENNLKLEENKKPKERKPVDREKLITIKKDSIAYAKNKMFPSKNNKNVHPNIFSKKNRK
jgi:glycosyltransferase involved in cell wall biosynthesis